MKEERHYFFDLQEENEEVFNHLLGYLNKVLTEEAKDNWLDDQFPMTISEWYFAIELLANATRTPFERPTARL